MKQYHGTREAFHQALLDLAETDDRVLFVSPDSLKAMRATPFAEQYPRRYVEVGIAEQGAVDVAAGLAASGLIPFIGTYAGFLTMRACEQMRTFVAYPNLNVKFVGINAGLMGGEREGVTHQFYEDLAVLSAIPNMTIFTPADARQTYLACLEAAITPGPVYIRAGSGREPEVYGEDTKFSPDGFTLLRAYGMDTLVFASGFILERVLQAADLLHEQGVRVTVADVNILYGKRQEKLIELLKTAPKAVTVEDHNINGGLGSYICHLAAEHHPIPVRRIGLTSFGESGPARELTDLYGFEPKILVQSIRNTL